MNNKTPSTDARYVHPAIQRPTTKKATDRERKIAMHAKAKREAVSRYNTGEFSLSLSLSLSLFSFDFDSS